MTGMRCPYAILTACSQSHAFQERRFAVPNSEEEAMKIGRSVARLKPSSDNAIFDCKVSYKTASTHAVVYDIMIYLLCLGILCCDSLPAPSVRSSLH